MRAPSRARGRIVVIMAALALALVVGACGSAAAPSGAGGGAAGATGSGRVRHVPAQFPTIQAAVDKAGEGDLVLIAPGTYYEAVKIKTNRLVLRGEDRNTVVLDGEFKKLNGITVQADGVAVENLTVRSYTNNGVFFTGVKDDIVGPDIVYGVGDKVVKGYRVSYVSAANNGLYGIYAFASRGGLIEHAYASGNPDSGLYIGQCKPCDATVTDSIAENNAVGYEGTNASGNVFVVRSVFRGNRIGITPNSQKLEKLAPQESATFAGNLVVDGNHPNTPEQGGGGWGIGIAVGGGVTNVITKNRVSGNPVAGILVTELKEYLPKGNRVEGNVVSGNGTDLVYAFTGTSDGATNCFSGNTFGSSLPDGIERVLACGAPPAPLPASTFAAPNAPRGISYRDMPAPPAQPGMADPLTAPARPAVGIVPAVDLAAITVPAAP